ncbi:hypothetical protein AVEN_269888-1 [Araneus ventricosus]|uniref:Uncharacterized protein n=1 Tax=Araneus ventricosus TaxID=182803 RepID=A0A4Y2IEE5_ARAVE|nr:hypothetical protein AVEN_269888-1 [Araneus ventricosus]
MTGGKQKVWNVRCLSIGFYSRELPNALDAYLIHVSKNITQRMVDIITVRVEYPSRVTMPASLGWGRTMAVGAVFHSDLNIRAVILQLGENAAAGRG